MKEKVTVTTSDNEVKEADVICYLQNMVSNKKYLFYTFNEKVDEKLVKLYVAEATMDGSSLTLTNIMTDEEWNELKGIMRSVLTGVETPNIKFLKVGDN